MTPKFFYNPHMNTNSNLNNILVPGREGYFEFLIDYTNVDSAFKFKFDIEQLNTSILEDFEVYGYAIIDTDTVLNETTKITDINDIQTLTKDENGKYLLSGLTQEINPAEGTEKQKRILILFRWNDGDGSAMDNLEDTQFVGEANGEELHKLLKYKIKVTFTQKI